MPIQAEELLRLQDLDTRLARLTRERKALDDGAALRAEWEALARQLAEGEARLHQLEAEQRAAELELKAVEEKKAHEERRLYSGKITVPKELQALEGELEMLGRQRSRLDEQVLTLMDEVEGTGRANAELKRQSEAARTRWETHRQEYLAEVKRLEKEIARRTEKRAAAAAELEPAALRLYEEIRARSNNLAAVRLEGKMCGGCKTNVSIVVARQATVGETYARCESCNRILLPPAGEK